jgi:hypothetical protein
MTDSDSASFFHGLKREHLERLQQQFAKRGLPAEPSDIVRHVNARLFPPPSASEQVHVLSAHLDPDIATALVAIQAARLTVSSIGALSQADVRFGHGCAFLSQREMSIALPYLVVYAAADVGLLFDSAGFDLLRLLQMRAPHDSATDAMRERLIGMWQRLKSPILSVRNNLAHHAPYSPKGHNYAMSALGSVTFKDLLSLLILAEVCAASLAEPIDEVALAAHRELLARVESDEASSWSLSAPRCWIMYPSFGRVVNRIVRWPGAITTQALRWFAERIDRRNAPERIDWNAAPDANAMALGAYGANCSAALSQLYAALLWEEVGCGTGHHLAGPLTRSMARTRVLQLFYASVVRLFEPGRINILASAQSNWSVLPRRARSLFATYLWPLWRAREADLQAFRNCGGYHMTSTDRQTAAWRRLQQRLHHHTVHALLYMSHAYLAHSHAFDIGIAPVRPYPSEAPSLAFDPRHRMFVYDKLLHGSFVESEDWSLILEHQPSTDAEQFPRLTEREAGVRPDSSAF